MRSFLFFIFLSLLSVKGGGCNRNILPPTQIPPKIEGPACECFGRKHLLIEIAMFLTLKEYQRFCDAHPILVEKITLGDYLQAIGVQFQTLELSLTTKLYSLPSKQKHRIRNTIGNRMLLGNWRPQTEEKPRTLLCVKISCNERPMHNIFRGFLYLRFKYKRGAYPPMQQIFSWPHIGAFVASFLAPEEVFQLTLATNRFDLLQTYRKYSQPGIANEDRLTRLDNFLAGFQKREFSFCNQIDDYRFATFACRINNPETALNQRGVFLISDGKKTAIVFRE